MNIAAWSDSTKRWAEVGNSKIVAQVLQELIKQSGAANGEGPITLRASTCYGEAMTTEALGRNREF